MTTPTTPTSARKSSLSKWLKRLLWLSLIPIVLVAGYYSLILYLVLGGTFSSAKFVYSDPCGNGEYRLLKYKYDNGDGYFELVNRSGKVLDKLKFSEGGEGWGSINWSEDCLAVYVPGDDGPTLLEVVESGPAHFEWEATPR